MSDHQTENGAFKSRPLAHSKKLSVFELSDDAKKKYLHCVYVCVCVLDITGS